MFDCARPVIEGGLRAASHLCKYRNIDYRCLCTYTLSRGNHLRPEEERQEQAKRGLSFDRAAEFNFDTAIVQEDDRVDYGETRLRAFGLLDGRMHALVYTETEAGIRVISFRRATKHEVKLYGR